MGWAGLLLTPPSGYSHTGEVWAVHHNVYSVIALCGVLVSTGQRGGAHQRATSGGAGHVSHESGVVSGHCLSASPHGCSVCTTGHLPEL